MLGLHKIFKSNSEALLEALSYSLAIVEFDTAGNVLSANENFCSTLGYQQSEIVGHHHRMFVEPNFAATPEYQGFWAKLSQGEYDAREYKRIG